MSDTAPYVTGSSGLVIDVSKLTDAEPAEIVGETEAGTPVSAATALRWCCADLLHP